MALGIRKGRWSRVKGEESVGCWTSEELIICCIARQFTGERIAVGASILSDIGAKLAKALYQPDLVILGGSTAAFDCNVGPKIFEEEFLYGPVSKRKIDWIEYFD